MDKEFINGPATASKIIGPNHQTVLISMLRNLCIGLCVSVFEPIRNILSGEE